MLQDEKQTSQDQEDLEAVELTKISRAVPEVRVTIPEKEARREIRQVIRCNLPRVVNQTHVRPGHSLGRYPEETQVKKSCGKDGHGSCRPSACSVDVPPVSAYRPFGIEASSGSLRAAAAITMKSSTYEGMRDGLVTGCAKRTSATLAVIGLQTLVLQPGRP